uniref:Alpha-L-iduronidase n=1 Tax=Cuerna arida TaxID=1464854 RepID=A0A1B6EN25_9HEMI
MLSFTNMKHTMVAFKVFQLVGLLLVTPTRATTESLGSDFDVVVDMTTSVGDMRRIWDNTGLSPPGPGEAAVEYLTSKEQLVNLALIGSLPFKGISHVRIHWLLDLITVNYTDVEPCYNFQSLDYLIWWLKVHRMKPGFELMGNPGGIFNDLDSNPQILTLWEKFISSLAAHYISKFGKNEVERWRFELWNEPDSKQYNILNLTTSGYLRYALASMRALESYNLSMSGPAGTFRDLEHNNISWSLLQMCNTLLAVTGRCGLNTITFHKKGDGDAQQVFTSSAEFYSTATTFYQLLKKIPFANNEADILTGWWREEEWRGDVNYAARVVEVLTTFLATVNQQNFSVAYISNDNGFINQFPAYFNQRTLLTRFQMNFTEDHHNQFIRKPVMVTMGLLSYLGPKEMPVFLRHLTNSSDSDSRISVLAAGDGVDVGPGWSAAVVLAVNALQPDCSDKTLQLNLRLPSSIEFTYIVYQLDNVLTNPKSIWEKNGKPDFPDATLLDEMRSNEGPYVGQTGSVVGDWEILSLQIKCPSVTLVHVCVRPQNPPGKVLQLHAINITFNEVLLLWQDSSTRCVKTYEVFFCSGDCLNDEYQLINNRTVLMLAYQFKATTNPDGVEGSRGKYKVRVHDYWDQLGAFSDVYVYP